MTEHSASDVAGVVKGLPKAQRAAISGRYYEDFVSHQDAAALERAGLWASQEPDEEDEFWRFVVTSLGLAARAAILSEREGEGR